MLIEESINGEVTTNIFEIALLDETNNMFRYWKYANQYGTDWALRKNYNLNKEDAYYLLCNFSAITPLRICDADNTFSAITLFNNKKITPKTSLFHCKEELAGIRYVLRGVEIRIEKERKRREFLEKNKKG